MAAHSAWILHASLQRAEVVTAAPELSEHVSVAKLQAVAVRLRSHMWPHVCQPSCHSCCHSDCRIQQQQSPACLRFPQCSTYVRPATYASPCLPLLQAECRLSCKDELHFLEQLVARNRSQHRRTDYFQRLEAMWRCAQRLQRAHGGRVLDDLVAIMQTPLANSGTVGAPLCPLTSSVHAAQQLALT